MYLEVLVIIIISFKPFFYSYSIQVIFKYFWFTEHFISI